MANMLQSIPWKVILEGFVIILSLFYSEAQAATHPSYLSMDINCSTGTIQNCLENAEKATGVSIYCYDCQGCNEKVFRYHGPLSVLLEKVAEACEIQSYLVQCSDTICEIGSLSSLNAHEPQKQDRFLGKHNDMVEKNVVVEGTLKGDYLDPLDAPVLPTPGDSEHSLTLREARMIDEKNNKTLTQEMLLDMEILPPNKDGEKGITLREIKRLQNTNDQRVTDGNTLDVEVIPPTTAGGKGVTLREIQKLRNNNDQTLTDDNMLDVEVIPPGTAGEKGVTLREIRKLKPGTDGILNPPAMLKVKDLP